MKPTHTRCGPSHRETLGANKPGKHASLLASSKNHLHGGGGGAAARCRLGPPRRRPAMARKRRPMFPRERGTAHADHRHIVVVARRKAAGLLRGRAHRRRRYKRALAGATDDRSATFASSWSWRRVEVPGRRSSIARTSGGGPNTRAAVEPRPPPAFADRKETTLPVTGPSDVAHGSRVDRRRR